MIYAYLVAPISVLDPLSTGISVKLIKFHHQKSFRKPRAFLNLPTGLNIVPITLTLLFPQNIIKALEPSICIHVHLLVVFVVVTSDTFIESIFSSEMKILLKPH